jgi:hypothetical protein
MRCGDEASRNGDRSRRRYQLGREVLAPLVASVVDTRTRPWRRRSKTACTACNLAGHASATSRWAFPRFPGALPKETRDRSAVDRKLETQGLMSPLPCFNRDSLRLHLSCVTARSAPFGDTKVTMSNKGLGMMRRRTWHFSATAPFFSQGTGRRHRHLLLQCQHS